MDSWVRLKKVKLCAQLRFILAQCRLEPQLWNLLSPISIFFGGQTLIRFHGKFADITFLFPLNNELTMNCFLENKKLKEYKTNFYSNIAIHL